MSLLHSLSLVFFCLLTISYADVPTVEPPLGEEKGFLPKKNVTTTMFDPSAIIGGTDATAFTANFTVRLIMAFSDSSTSLCTGSILANDLVLTAAHCIYSDSKTVSAISIEYGGVYPGDRSINYAKALYIHPDYCGIVSKSDIAVIQTWNPFDSSKSGKVTISSKYESGSIVQAAGFGLTSVGGSVSTTLLQVSLRIQSASICGAGLSVNFMNRYFGKAVLCATHTDFPTGSGQSTCGGDSGGPLFKKKGSKFRQFGITSFGPEDCAMAGGRAGYVRTKSFNKMLRAAKAYDFSAWYQL